MGSLREHVCETLRDLRGVLCSQGARCRLRKGRAHVLAWRIPRIARFVFFYARVTSWLHVWCGIRQEGVIPCRMVPSMWDEVRGQLHDVTGKVRHARLVSAAQVRIQNLKRINLGTKSKPRFRVNMISPGLG